MTQQKESQTVHVKLEEKDNVSSSSTPKCVISAIQDKDETQATHAKLEEKDNVSSPSFKRRFFVPVDRFNSELQQTYDKLVESENFSSSCVFELLKSQLETAHSKIRDLDERVRKLERTYDEYDEDY